MAKKVLYRLPKIVDSNGRKIIINKLRKYVVDEDEDFQYERGKVTAEEIKRGGQIKKEKDNFLAIPYDLYDVFGKLKRKAQIITDKDAGKIISKTLITKESKVLESGTGSGFLTARLALTGAKVVSVENNKNHYDVAKQNIETLNLNVNLHNVNINDFETNSSFTHIILDLPKPWECVDSMTKMLETGGFLIVYSTNITQAKTFFSHANDYLHIETVELMERSWKITPTYARPKSQSAPHTGFLSFYRKSL